MDRPTRLCSVLVLALMVAGCDNPSKPSGPLTGTWSGTLTDSVVGAGTVRLTIAQSGQSLTGSWGSTFSDPTFNNSGTLTGTFSGSAATITLSPSSPTTCPFFVTATVSGSAMTGTYAAINCTVAVSGSVSVTKE